MEIGIGIPATIPGATRDQILGASKRAEDRGFSSIGTIDRLVYPNHEPLVTLGAVAAVTERIRLTTAVLLVPWRQNAALLAKQLATVQSLSNGRVVVGAGLGARGDDYDASGMSTRRRGQRFDEMLDEITRVWAGESRGIAGAIGPDVRGGAPEIILGGNVDAAFIRAAKYGNGWIAGGGTPEGYEEKRGKMVSAWKAAGRPGKPRMLAMAYCALGPDADAAASKWIRSYYAFAGDYADVVVGRAAKTPADVRTMIKAYADQGCDELILFPCSAELDQVDRLADVVLN